jgi:hypothetical protein
MAREITFTIVGLDFGDDVLCHHAGVATHEDFAKQPARLCDGAAPLQLFRLDNAAHPF